MSVHITDERELGGVFDGGGLRHACRQWRTLEVIRDAAATRRASRQNAPVTVPRTLLRKVGLPQCLGVGEPGASSWRTAHILGC